MVLPPVSQLTWSEFLLLIIITTLLFELITVVLRFIFELRAETSLAFVGVWTRGYRVHHMYIGLFLCLIARAIEMSPYWDNAVMIVGAALIISDLLHHYVVLWPLTGSHEFHLKYPPNK